ncbi:uncharacterized protein LOC131596787 [Vicia villosa]|uniref:uncharacterized protein LOC131596787 n=1 Tax=Vicia villosa TaxID=3911 RepID=UPI00273BA31B|nr:uncharacterized protein LOC131596787 [Vicia villosa]
MRKAKDLGDFRCFKVGDNEEVDLLQFADDTIIISEGDTANLWSMKAILRGFELMSGLRINFSKSNIYGINVGDWFLEAASSFLSCKVSSLPFKYLGIKVGGNPRTPTKVLQEIRTIQSKFLWSGGEDRKSIHWVCWDTVCKSKEEGGLGIKNVEIMNVALISKWKWRILNENEAVWSGIIRARYGKVKLKILVGDMAVVGKKDSIWWRDLMVSDNYERLLVNHFSRAINCSVGNGEDIPFWYACWIDKQPLLEVFPDLFQVTADHLLAVADLGQFGEDGWQWNLRPLLPETAAAWLPAASTPLLPAASTSSATGLLNSASNGELQDTIVYMDVEQMGTIHVR